jgi:hypothetical protein
MNFIIVAGVFRSIDIDMLLRVRRLPVLVLLLRGERHVLKTFGGVLRSVRNPSQIRFSTYHPGADTDYHFHLMRIRIRIFI